MFTHLCDTPIKCEAAVMRVVNFQIGAVSAVANSNSRNSLADSGQLDTATVLRLQGTTEKPDCTYTFLRLSAKP